MGAKKTTIKPLTVEKRQKPQRVRTVSAKDTFSDAATRQVEEKRTAAISVYLTPEKRRAFRRWAFDREVSMSDLLAAKVDEIMAEEE